MAPTSDPVITWMLTADPAIRWQVMRDLFDVPEAEWLADRAKVETEGWGAALFSHQDPNGQWAGDAFWPRHMSENDEQPWTATYFALQQLRLFGLVPTSESAKRTVELVGKNSRWKEWN